MPESDSWRGWPKGSIAQYQSFIGWARGQGQQSIYGQGFSQIISYWSQSIQGGGYYGLFDAQSIQGGGSVSGLTVAYDSRSVGIGGTLVAFFVKVASLPASDMMLCDLNGGASGYLRVKLKSNGHLVAECTVGGVTPYTLDIGVNAIALNTEYWVVAAEICRGAGNVSDLIGKVTSAAGVSSGQQLVSMIGTYSPTFGTFTATLGVGMHLSTAYLDFPNTVGNELSKLQVQHSTTSNPAVPAPPSGDVSASGLDALYLCRDAIGSVSGTLSDSTSNHRNLTPGPNGMTVVVDGPYP